MKLGSDEESDIQHDSRLGYQTNLLNEARNTLPWIGRVGLRIALETVCYKNSFG